VRLVLILALVGASSACTSQPSPQPEKGEAQEAQSLKLSPAPPGLSLDRRCLVDLASVSLAEMIEGATYIVVIRVTQVGGSESVSGSHTSYYRVRGELVEALRGTVSATFEFALNSCGGAWYDFELGRDYLVFAEPLTFGDRLDVIAPMGYRQGVFRLSADGEAVGDRGEVNIAHLQDRLLP
jgi:hypothetical protein